MDEKAVGLQGPGSHKQQHKWIRENVTKRRRRHILGRLTARSGGEDIFLHDPISAAQPLWSQVMRRGDDGRGAQTAESMNASNGRRCRLHKVRFKWRVYLPSDGCIGAFETCY